MKQPVYVMSNNSINKERFRRSLPACGAAGGDQGRNDKSAILIAISNKRLRNNKGVTLVEVMISLVILLIVFMGLIQASLLSMQSNMKNVLRDEAVRITADRMSILRSAVFTDMDKNGSADTADPLAYSMIYGATLNLATNPQTHPELRRTVRSATVDYTVGVSVCGVSCLDADHKQMTVTTTWSWQGENFTHSIVATRGR
jgi:prepilin-type N-terminal cleavage/methylation domain-containing protein